MDSVLIKWDWFFLYKDNVYVSKGNLNLIWCWLLKDFVINFFKFLFKFTDKVNCLIHDCSFILNFYDLPLYIAVMFERESINTLANDLKFILCEYQSMQTSRGDIINELSTIRLWI